MVYICGREPISRHNDSTTPYHGGHGVVAEMGPEGSVVSGENNES